MLWNLNVYDYARYIFKELYLCEAELLLSYDEVSIYSSKISLPSLSTLSFIKMYNDNKNKLFDVISTFYSSATRLEAVMELDLVKSTSDLLNPDILMSYAWNLRFLSIEGDSAHLSQFLNLATEELHKYTFEKLLNLVLKKFSQWDVIQIKNYYYLYRF